MTAISKERYKENYAVSIALRSEKSLRDYHASNLTHAPWFSDITAAELTKRGIDPAEIEPKRSRWWRRPAVRT